MFTLNNYCDTDVSQLTDSMRSTDQGSVGSKTSYAIFGKEIGESGTPHLQGFLMLKNQAKFAYVKELLSQQFVTRGVHIEQGLGTPIQAMEYCKKDGQYLETGVPPKGQGARSDLAQIQQELNEGATDAEIATAHFSKWVVYRRSFTAYRNLMSQNEVRHVPEVIVLWGPTGTGKTRQVHQALGSLWSWPGGKWFDGYQDQDNALFDDFDGDLPFRLLLRLLDRYRLQVPVKGGFAWWNPKTIWITSNKKVEEWYPFEDISPLMRRITRVTHVE